MVGLVRRRLDGFFLTPWPASPAPTAFWAFKVGQKLTAPGIGSTRSTQRSKVLVYYTTFDPVDVRHRASAGTGAGASVAEANTDLHLTVQKFDDAGTGTPAVGARLGERSLAARADEAGHATIDRIGNKAAPGTGHEPGAIRSTTLWIDVVSSSSRWRTRRGGCGRGQPVRSLRARGRTVTSPAASDRP